MCVFCAALPVTVSVGAAVTARQKEQQREAKVHTESPPVRIPAGQMTVAVVVGVIVLSAIYHTVVMPRIGV
jgi:hypothetical protein